MENREEEYEVAKRENGVTMFEIKLVRVIK